MLRVAPAFFCCLLGSAGALKAQQGPDATRTGSVLAEYRSGSNVSFPNLYALDLATGAAYTVWLGRSGSFQITLRTPDGRFFEGPAGAAALIPIEHCDLSPETFDEAFPFLLPALLSQLPAHAVRVETLDDGSTLYACTLISGSVATTIRGLPEGFTAATRRVDYTFGPDGRLHSIKRHDTGETETLEYIDDAKDPKLAIPKSFTNGAWILHEYEIHPGGRPDLFTPEAVTARARDMLIAFNERQEEMSQTLAARRQLTKSIEQLGGESAPLRTTRLALILTGLIVVAVGSLAWWKHRS